MSNRELLLFTLGLFLLFGLAFVVALNWERMGFVKVRSNPMKNSCIANLKQIDGAIQQWVLENRIAETNTYSLDDPALLSYMKGSRLPVCPEGGMYIEGSNVTNMVRCNFASRGHTL